MTALSVSGVRSGPRVVSSEAGVSPVVVTQTGKVVSPSAYLETLRKSLPTEPGDRRLAWSFPSVTLQEMPKAALIDARGQLSEHLESKHWPKELTSALGYPGVRAALDMLQSESLEDPESALRAERLNRYLQGALFFDGIHVRAKDYQRARLKWK